MSVFPKSVCLVVWLVAISSVAQEAEKYADRPPDDVQRLYDLLQRSDIIQELQITPSQYADLRASRGAGTELSENLTRQMPSLSQQEIEAARHQVYVAKVAAAATCLTREQLQRLEQLLIQYQVFAQGPAHLLARTLELSEEEKRQLSELEAELTTQLRELMWRLHRRVQRELVSSLTSEQQTQWRNRVGADYEFVLVFTGLKPLQGLTCQVDTSDRYPDYTHVRLMNRSDVQKELELVDDQLTAVTYGRTETLEKLDSLRKQSAIASANGRTEETRRITLEVMELNRRSTEAKAKARQELLLPHQLERLDELVWQYRSIPEPVRIITEAVGASERQREQLQLQASDLCSQVTEELWGFHRIAQRRILDSLTPAHQIEWKKQLGEEFKFKSTTESFQVLRYLR